ncbi:Protein O-mannosyl-transferase 1 [Galemys pyrenaicus]|uniref:Protein O-mannosyl-transferase 1 n=1 Tax=Galemys pyrenaicus TaxID=202257 RepID=A0A8J5ZYV6_GALPY|nr:Protein O-mannosyl-transferase 1 [Galemys pyrenaicus]
MRGAPGGPAGSGSRASSRCGVPSGRGPCGPAPPTACAPRRSKPRQGAATRRNARSSAAPQDVWRAGSVGAGPGKRAPGQACGRGLGRGNRGLRGPRGGRTGLASLGRGRGGGRPGEDGGVPQGGPGGEGPGLAGRCGPGRRRLPEGGAAGGALGLRPSGGAREPEPRPWAEARSARLFFASRAPSGLFLCKMLGLLKRPVVVTARINLSVVALTVAGLLSRLWQLTYPRAVV